MRIDSHQHFWSYNAQEYEWMGKGLEALRRDYLPPDLAPLLAASRLDGTVAVQARQSLEESTWLLELADKHPFIRGVVGWVDLRSPGLEADLARLSRHPKFRGVRHVLQDEPEEFMLRPEFVRGIGVLRNLGLTYDLLLYARHLPAACKLVQRFPEQPFVLDHISKPLIKSNALEPWATDIRRLAEFPNVVCKISGMVTEADWQAWRSSDFIPYLDIVLDCFGAKRLMVGSDWPVCTLAGRYDQVIQIASDFISKLPQQEQEAVWGGNAQRFYGLPT